MGLEVQEGKCPYCSDPWQEIVTDVAELVKIYPLPAINLTTGEKMTAEPPYNAIRVTWIDDGDDVAEDFIPIHYCPMCGRKLETPKKGDASFGNTGR